MNADGKMFGSALRAAIHKGHDLIVELLLENGAIDEDLEEEESDEQDDDVGGTEREADDSSESDNSEDEWASAQGDAEDI